MAPGKKTRKSLTPEQRQERLNAAHNALMEQVETLTTSEGWRAMLSARRWLRRYSLNNLLLIIDQCEHATDVRGYGAWKKAGRQVRRGEKGIRILAPARYRARDDNGDPVNDNDGNPQYRVRGFKVETVFDISQTDGEPVPESEQAAPTLLTGAAPPQLWDVVVDMVTTRGYEIERADTAPANGWVRWDTRTVRISDTVEDAQAVKTLVHELAHIVCEHDTRDLPRAMGEVEAESVACLVTNLVGLDSLPYSVPYVAGWAKDADTARNSAQQVLSVADEIAAALVKALPDAVTEPVPA